MIMNTHNNCGLGFTHNKAARANSVLLKALFARAKNGENHALFELGILCLQRKKPRSARVFFKSAALSGNEKALRYFMVLNKAEKDLSLWCDIILCAERANIWSAEHQQERGEKQ